MKRGALLAITPIPCLRDNYAYLIEFQGEAWVVDPSESKPVLQALSQRRLQLSGILATHHHLDHVGGISELVAAFPRAWVAAHGSDRGRIPEQTVAISATNTRWFSTELQLGPYTMLARHVPGHTLGAVAYGFATLENPGPQDVFTGDTLFGAGCGRLFEGEPAQLFHSLQAFAALDSTTRLWFGHEYTRKNLEFAKTIEPKNQEIAQRLQTLPSCTTPTTVALENATNPFLRVVDLAGFIALRHAKDRF